MQNAECNDNTSRVRREVADRGCFASQFRVKLGTIRPATTEISTMTAASPRRHPSPGGTATPSASRCISRLATPRTVTGATIGRLRQFRPATISRATTPTSTTGNDRSAAMASHGGRVPRPGRQSDPAAIARPAAPAAAADRQPPRPVRDGGEQEAGDGRHHEAEQHLMDMPGSGSNRLGRAAPVANMTIQMASATAAQRPAARKNGRKPWVRNAGIGCRSNERSVRFVVMFIHFRKGAPLATGVRISTIPDCPRPHRRW